MNLCVDYGFIKTRQTFHSYLFTQSFNCLKIGMGINKHTLAGMTRVNDLYSRAMHAHTHTHTHTHTSCQ